MEYIFEDEVLNENIKNAIIIIFNKYKSLIDDDTINSIFDEVISNINLNNKKKNIKKFLIYEFEKRVENYITLNFKTNSDVLKVLNNYINTSISNTKNYEESIEEIDKLGKKMYVLINVLNPDIYIELLKNKKINNLVGIIVKDKIDYFKDNLVSSLFSSSEIVTLIETYCSENDINILEYDSLSDDGISSSLQIYLNSINEPLLTRKEEKELCDKIKQGDIDAKNKLINHNLRLVINIAKEFKGKGLDLEDLVQEGNLGLIRATESFDADKGFKFSTYATWWIKQSINRGIENSSKTVRIPTHIYERIKKYSSTFRKLMKSLNREPTKSEICKELNITESELNELLKYKSDVLSINQIIGEDEDTELGELIESELATPEDQIMKLSIEKRLSKILSHCYLSEREIDIIKERFGFNGEPLTLESLGKKYNVSRERIRQLEVKALNKIRNSCSIAELEDLAEYYNIKKENLNENDENNNEDIVKKKEL